MAAAATRGERGIFVATADVGRGVLLTPEMVKLEPWPKDKIPDGAISNAKDLEGRRTRTRLYVGEPILDNRLLTKGSNEQGATAMIPPGYRVVPVKVDLVSGGSSMIWPGDHVDVMVHLVRDVNHGINETATQTILQDIKVFAVNDLLDVEKEKEKDGAKSVTATTISLLVTPEQAAKLMLATHLGIINLVMRSPDDDKVDANVVARPSDIFGNSDASQHEKDDRIDLLMPRTPAAPVAPPVDNTPKARPMWSMQIVKPGGVEDVTFEQESNPDSPSGQNVWRNITTANASIDVPPVNQATQTPPPANAPALPEPAKPGNVKPGQPTGPKIVAGE